jgi:hypothetical protein
MPMTPRTQRETGYYLIRVALAALAQAVAMVVIGLFFLFNDAASGYFYPKLRFLEDIVPILWRYHGLSLQRGGVFEYEKIFAIYTLYLCAQALMVIFICYVLFNVIDLSRPNRMKTWQWFCFVFLMAVTLFPNIDLLFGPYNISDPGFFENRLARGNYLSAIFRFCLIAPVGNLCFVFFMILAFGRPDHILDKADLPRIKKLHH